MTDKLKPCAHCAEPGIEVEQRRGDFHEWSIECSGCYCRTDWYGSRDVAIAAWNACADDSPKRTCELEETESYKACYADYDGNLKMTTVHVLECSECGRTCEHVNGTYPRCPYCSSVNVLDENYEPQVIENAENYKLADNSGPQVIAIGEKPKSANKPDSREKLNRDLHALCCELQFQHGVSGEAVWCGSDEQNIFDRIMAMFDRQAAITRAEVFENGEYDCMTCGAKRELQERVDSLTDERDYWKDQVHQCVIKAVNPGGYTAGIMRYPRTDGYCEPSLMVTDAIDSLKDFYADEKRMNDKLTAERDELSNTVDKLIQRVDGLFCLNDLSDKRIKELEAEVEAQRKRANDAERGVLSDEWYVSRDRYEDDIAELKADVKKWADAANEQRLVAMEQADKVQEITAERNHLSRDLEAEHALVTQFETDNENLREERDYWKKQVGKCLDHAVNAYAPAVMEWPRAGMIVEPSVLVADEFEELRKFNGKCAAENIRLQADVDEKQHVCDVQRESFRKMEKLLADAKAADYTAMRDEAEKLSAENARLKAENRELCLGVYGAPF